jgi:hypothetical protein
VSTATACAEGGLRASLACPLDGFGRRSPITAVGVEGSGERATTAALLLACSFLKSMHGTGLWRAGWALPAFASAPLPFLSFSFLFFSFLFFSFLFFSFLLVADINYAALIEDSASLFFLSHHFQLIMGD